MAIILFGSSVSPFARKALIAAAEKGIELDHRQTGLQSKDTLFQSASPFGKIPAMVDGDFSLADSTAIVTYFEGIKPEPALIPQAPKPRAKAIWFEEFADTILGAAVGAVFFNRIVSPRFLKREGDAVAIETALTQTLPKVFAYLETQMTTSGFLVDDRLTIADISVICPLMNYHYAGEVIDATAYPKLAAYFATHVQRPSIAPDYAETRKTMGLDR